MPRPSLSLSLPTERCPSADPAWDWQLRQGRGRSASGGVTPERREGEARHHIWGRRDIPTSPASTSGEDGERGALRLPRAASGASCSRMRGGEAERSPTAKADSAKERGEGGRGGPERAPSPLPPPVCPRGRWLARAVSTCPRSCSSASCPWLLTTVSRRARGPASHIHTRPGTSTEWANASPRTAVTAARRRPTPLSLSLSPP